MISIIIPCYNTGQFLLEAFESVRAYVQEDYEVILVNDGSTDDLTINVLNGIDDPSIKIINQANMGLASARNVGVTHSNGEILFFLDSDNTVLADYSSEAVKIFARNPEVSVVYGNPVFFGEVEAVPRFSTRPYDFDQLLRGNYIDACAFVRKKDFLAVGGFSAHPDLQGWDDWDLWIKLSIAGKKFHYLDSDCFGYRVRRNSMIGNSTNQQKKAMLEYLGAKYGHIFHEKYRRYFRIVQEIQKRPIGYSLKILYYKYIIRKPLI